MRTACDRATDRGGASIEVRGLTWTPLGRRRPILDGVDLRVEPGERVLVVGASGAGKSTLLRAIAGVVDAVDPGTVGGRVSIDGVPARGGDGRVGLLVQDPADARVAGTIGRDVAFGPENLGVPRSEIRTRVAEALAAVGLPYGLGHATAALSGGEAKRLALAGVLALAPTVLLLDEPTSMLDDASAETVRAAVLSSVTERGATLVVVEHRIDGWVDVLDRLVVVGKGGRVIADGPTRRVLRDREADLVAAGVWVPGAPAPTPLEVPADLVTPWQPGDGALARRTVPLSGPLVVADEVGLVRRLPRGLRVVRGTEPDIIALDGVTARVETGRALALRGPSGAGKSTLLGLLLGLGAPTSGRVSADAAFSAGAGPDPRRWPSTELAARVGWVPQRAELTITSTRSVRDCLLATPAALGRLDGRTAQAATRRVDDLLDVLDLGRLARRHPHRLSGGELRRLAVAGALAHGPALVGFDEPTVGQDRRTWAAVTGLLLAARRAGCGVVASTHDDLLATRCDRTLWLSGGRAASPPGDASQVAPRLGEAR